MADVDKGLEGQKQEPVNQEPAQLTEIEQRASTQGWVPKDEWDGDPEQWRPAKEFLDRGELFKKIDDQNRTIKEFKKTLEEFAKHHSKVQKVEYDRALADLKAAKKVALNEGDADAVIDVDERIALVREAQKEAEAPVQVPNAPAEINPVFRAWVEKNSWYEHSPAMRAYADRLGNELGARGGFSPTDLLAQIEREVKKEFAHKFNNPNRDKPGAVEGSTNKGSKKNDSFALSDDERRVMQRFIKTVPGMTEEKYVADLKKIKGVS
jgi:hypothetical protein